MVPLSIVYHNQRWNEDTRHLCLVIKSSKKNHWMNESREFKENYTALSTWLDFRSYFWIKPVAICENDRVHIPTGCYREIQRPLYGLQSRGRWTSGRLETLCTIHTSRSIFTLWGKPSHVSIFASGSYRQDPDAVSHSLISTTD